MSDTIYALSTARGKAGIAVIRLSGPAAGAALGALTGRAALQPRRAMRARFRDPATGAALDDGLALWFPGPGSVTGEDVAELHAHGGRATVAALLQALAALPGLRPAEPGDFTRRAFHNGKLDLSAVEGLADLIDAETEAQRRQALLHLEGALGRQAEDWRARLIRALAHYEAAIDFPDEGDVPADIAERARPEIGAVAREIGAMLADARRGELLREGLSVAILGAPNAGKSSLLNALVRRDVAIVSAIAGTTRDIVEARLDLSGYPVLLADTAGLRELGERADPVEAEGIARARRRAEAADLKLLVVEAGTPPDPALRALADDDALWIASKRDLAPAAALPQGALPVSAKTGAGLPELLDRLAVEAERRLSAGTAPAITRHRHRHALTDCAAALARAGAATAPELAAEDLRLALSALGRLTGRVDVEDVLDVIFAEFCIGK